MTLSYKDMNLLTHIGSAEKLKEMLTHYGSDPQAMIFIQAGFEGWSLNEKGERESFKTVSPDYTRKLAVMKAFSICAKEFGPSPTASIAPPRRPHRS